MKLRELQDKAGAKQLEKEISGSKTVSKLWLLEKAKELVDELKDKN